MCGDLFRTKFDSSVPITTKMADMYKSFKRSIQFTEYVTNAGSHKN